MNSVKNIGMDVHLATISIVVLNAAGKLMMEVTTATPSGAILDFIRGVSGTLHVTLEEGTYAEWLCDLLLPEVAEVVVCDPRRTPRRRRENKSDHIDARQLAESLRVGTLKSVYHGNASRRALKELAKSYLALVGDTTRVMNRLKAVYRARGAGFLETSNQRIVTQDEEQKNHPLRNSIFMSHNQNRDSRLTARPSGEYALLAPGSESKHTK